MSGFGSLAQTPDEPYPEEGAGMPETFQSPAGRAIANIGIGLAKAIWDIPRKLGQAAEVPAGLRREDVTDIPVRRGITGTNQFGSEPQDELIEGTTGSAINRIGTGLPFAPRGVGAFGGRLRVPAPAAEGVLPQFAERYPETAPPQGLVNEKGKPYLAKVRSPEEEALLKARLQMKPDIDTGNYTPYFDPAKRTDVNPRPYGEAHDTTTNLMKRPEAVAKYDALAQNPEGVARLEDAYARGLGQKDQSGNWYFMGQLEKEFIKEYGPAEGRRMFKERFADSMAATTGGADPTANLLMAHYGNYLKQKGLPVPNSYEFPSPVGGQYAANNMGQFQKMIMEGQGIDPVANPKRYNFSGNFIGRKGATIDEQMSGLWDPKMQMPAGGSYGHFEKVLHQLADKHGVDPRYFQEVAWAGAKDAKTKGGYAAKPMITHVNDAIERTHRITGMARPEIVRRALVRSEIPLYGLGAAVGAAGLLGDRGEE